MRAARDQISLRSASSIHSTQSNVCSRRVMADADGQLFMVLDQTEGAVAGKVTVLLTVQEPEKEEGDLDAVEDLEIDQFDLPEGVDDAADAEEDTVTETAEADEEQTGSKRSKCGQSSVHAIWMMLLLFLAVWMRRRRFNREV